MKKNWITTKSDKLFRAILQLENLDEARNFFRDLLTEQEIEEFSNRWEAARMLAKNIPYSRIEQETGMSSTTIARISKWLNDGMGGYKSLIDKKNNQSTHHAPA